MSALITLYDLETRGACAEEAEMFRKKFGDAATVTVESAVAARLFSWKEAARLLLVGEERRAFLRAQAAAEAVYMEAFRKAEVDRSTSAEEACATMNTAHAVFVEACARAWAQAYIEQERRGPR